MENKNLKNKIFMICDFMYNLNNKQKYTVKNIDIEKVKLNDIKICINNSSYYNDFKKNILDSKLKFISFDYYDNNNSLLFFKLYFKNYILNLKINYYLNNDTHDINSNPNNESYISYILSSLVLLNKTKHILLPIINFDISVNDLSFINEFINKFPIKLNNQQILCLHIREGYMETVNLYDYIKTNSLKIIKPLLFQLIHTLYIIIDNFKYFNHNNLKVRSILVYITKNNKNLFEYLINNDKYYLPNINFEIKIMNFEKSILKKQQKTKNNIPDLITFIDDLIENFDISSELINILKLFKTKNNYEEILYNNYFDEYKNNNLISKDSLMNIREISNIKNKFTGIKLIRKLQDGGVNFDDNIVIRKPPGASLLPHQIKEIYKSDKKDKADNKLKEEPYIAPTNVKQIERYHELPEPIKEDKTPKENTLSNPSKFKQIHHTQNTYPLKEEQYSNPYQTNENKEYKKQFDTSKFKENKTQFLERPQVLMEQRMYNTEMQKYKDKPPQTNPMYVPIYPNDFTGGQMIMPFPYHNMAPVQKVYNINFGDNISNFTALDRIYEDYLPGGAKRFTALTIYDRLNLIQFVRNSIIKQSDGEDMKLSGSSDTILSYMKIININPYHKHEINYNPFKHLALNFLLYTAGYPIKYNNDTRKIEIGNPAMGINIRIYPLSIIDIESNNNTDKYDHNIWRELKYYDFVISDIVRRNISPNFINIILWKIDSECKINWDELERIKERHMTKEILHLIKLNASKLQHNGKTFIQLLSEFADKTHYNVYLTYMNQHQFQLDINGKTEDVYFEINKLNNYKHMVHIDRIHYKEQITLIEGNTLSNEYYIKILDKLIPVKLTKKDTDENIRHIEFSGKYPKIVPVLLSQIIIQNSTNPNKLTKKSIIMLTEAPTTSFIQWFTISYEPSGSIKKMISTGYHTEKVWETIIFQLIYIFSVLEKFNIYIDTLSLENNFFIKDVDFNPTSIGSWIYNINNIDYYIPNYGYILMFDSNYADLTKQSFDRNIKYKIMSSKLYGINNNLSNNTVLDEKNIKTLILDQFKNLINFNNWESIGHSTHYNTIPNKIKELLTEIHTYITVNVDYQIKDIFAEIPHFRIFLHNKVGTILTKDERTKIDLIQIQDIKKGILCVHKVSADNYTWVIPYDRVSDIPEVDEERREGDEEIGRDADDEGLRRDDGAEGTTSVRRWRVFKKTPPRDQLILERVLQSEIYTYLTNEKLSPLSQNEYRYDGSHIYEIYSLD